MTVTNHLKIERGRYPDSDKRPVRYEQRDDGWYVNTVNVDDQAGFRRYALPEARARDVRQLLRKEYDDRY